MLLVMAICAGYVFIRLYRKEPTDPRTSSISVYVISGMVIGAILGFLIGLYIIKSVTVKSEGDLMYLVLSTLFTIIAIGFGGMVVGVRKKNTITLDSLVSPSKPPVPVS